MVPYRPTWLQHTPKIAAISDIAGFESITWAQHGFIMFHIGPHGSNIYRKVAATCELCAMCLGQTWLDYVRLFFKSPWARAASMMSVDTTWFSLILSTMP